MAEQELKINVRGEMIPIHDIQSIVKASTKPEQESINKLKEDLVFIEKDNVIVKNFLNKLDALKTYSNNFISSGLNYEKAVFNQKFVIPVNLNYEDSLSHLAVELKSDKVVPDSSFTIEVKKIAKVTRLQSKNLGKSKSLVQKSTENNPNLFKAGTLEVLIKNQAQAIKQTFTSPTANITGNNPGQFKLGAFYINDCKITLASTETLASLMEKINKMQSETGVIADLISNNNNYQLLLRNLKIGDEAIMIDDLDGVFSNLDSNSSGQYFEQYKEYKNIDFKANDSLEVIVHKINQESNYTNLYAKTIEPVRGQKKLILEGKIPGLINNFEIKDNGIAVFNGFFEASPSFNPILQEASDSLIKLDDFEINQSTNSFTLDDSLIFNLKSLTSNPITFAVGMNFDLIAKTVQNFVEAYNSLRQTYETPTKPLQEGMRNINILTSDWSLGDFFRQIDGRLYLLKDNNNFSIADSFPELDIGLSFGKKDIEVEDAEGKKIIKTFDNMLLFNLEKFYKVYLSNPERLSNFFDLSFDSSSSNFIQPLLYKPIGINYQTLDNNHLELHLSVEPEKIRVYSYQSKIISNSAEPFNINLPNHFKSGTFWLNGKAITLTNNMSLEKIKDAFNKVSDDSRISASLEGNQIKLLQYQGGFAAVDDREQYDAIHLYDPGGLLAQAFNTDLTIDPIASSLTASSTNLVVGGKIKINDYEITLSGNTINSLLEDINACQDQTRVIAKAYQNSDGNYNLLFESEILAAIKLENLGGLLNIVIPSDNRDTFFFNTGEAVTGKVLLNGVEEDKLLAYRVAGENRNNGGNIKVTNYKNSNNQIDNLEVNFIGGYKDTAQIIFKQGLASFLMEKINRINPNSFSRDSLYHKFQQEIDNKKQKYKDDIDHKTKLLEDKQKQMTKKLSTALSSHDKYKAMEEMIKALSNSK